jgi:hypothetical protein
MRAIVGSPILCQIDEAARSASKGAVCSFAFPAGLPVY